MSPDIQLMIREFVFIATQTHESKTLFLSSDDRGRSMNEGTKEGVMDRLLLEPTEGNLRKFKTPK